MLQEIRQPSAGILLADFYVCGFLLFSGIACTPDSQAVNMDWNKEFFWSALRVPLLFGDSYACLSCPTSDIAPITKLPVYLQDCLEDFTCDGLVRRLSERTLSKQYKIIPFVSCEALL